MWNYQVIQYKDHVELVEAVRLYDLKINKKDGVVMTPKSKIGYTENMLTDKFESVEDLTHTLKLMLKDVKKYPPISSKKAGLTKK